MDNENEKITGKNASPRIVVNAKNLPYFSEKTIAAARAQGIIVSKSGEEPDMIFWPDEPNSNRLFLLKSGEDMLAGRAMDFNGSILAVTNDLEEMSDLSDVVESIINIGASEVWVCAPGKSLKPDPINAEFIERLNEKLGENVKVVRMIIEEGEEASVLGVFKYRADRKVVAGNENPSKNDSVSGILPAPIENGGLARWRMDKNSIIKLRKIDRILRLMRRIGLGGMVLLLITQILAKEKIIPLIPIIPKEQSHYLLITLLVTLFAGILLPSIVNLKYKGAYGPMWITRVYRNLGSNKWQS